jgi:class 3 adenylate cyclase/tetratricopeptide (TPR) repeat protein
LAACQACAAANPDGARFCSTCGERLAQACPACGALASGRFCNECGTALQPTAAPPRDSAAAPPAAPVAERRVTSVLFGDLVGFTTLSEARDAEEVRELLSGYFASARTIIERYGGTVEKFIGDAVMAVWGVPTAHEDDAERAVRAGFDLVDAVSSLGDELGAPGLAMRVGVVTGEVAVTIGATGEGMVAGDAVNTAARVQAAAAPGEVWVDAGTRELTAAAVVYADAGMHELKGKAEPLQLFVAQQVVAAVGGSRRVDGLEAPFTGRDRELRLVKELFHASVEEGKPRLVSVVGPVGVGKSRLGWEFDKYTDGIEAVVRAHRGRCLSYGEGVAFWALAEIVRSRLAVLEGDPNEVVLDRLRAAMAEYVPDATEREWLLPRLATLVGVGDAQNASAYARDDLFAAWRTFIERVAVADAIGAIIVIDDLQWADAGLIDFLDHVLETARAPIFLLTFSRPEITERFPSFGTGRRATTIYLEPLPAAAMSEVLDGLVQGLPTDVRDTLVEQSEGVPLFAVETVRSLIDRDAVVPREGRYVLAADADQRVDLRDLTLPTSLHTLIAARLDGLPADERRTVQDAAVLGQSFTKEGLAEVQAAGGTVVDLDAVLPALVRKEFLAVESDPRSPERGHYRFVQALVRGVAYDTLSKRDRKARHLAAVDYLASEPDADTIPAVLASHLLDAHEAATSDPDAQDIARRAVVLLERAAARAIDLGAPLEARGHLERALAFAHDAETNGRLLEQTARAAFSYGQLSDATDYAEQSRQAYEELGRETDAGRVLAVWGEAQTLSGNGSDGIEPMVAVYERLQGNAEADSVRAALAAEIARAYWLSKGDAEGAIPWFDRAVGLAEAMEDVALLSPTLASYAGALVLVGRQHMGIGLLRVSLDLARTLDQPRLLIRPLNNLTCFLAARDLGAARSYAEEAISVAHRFAEREAGWMITATMLHVMWTQADWDSALALHDEIVDWVEESSAGLLIPAYVTAIKAARGEDVHLPAIAELQTRKRGDAVSEPAWLLLEAAKSRSEGDLQTASERSAAAVRAYVDAGGIDDDFPLFWITAVEDAIAVGEFSEAEQLVDIVGSAPLGHVPTYLRAQLPRLRAMVAVATGRDDGAEKDFVAAINALDEFGAPYYLARAQLDYGRWLIKRGRPAEAVPLLTAAAATFERAGARPWLAATQELDGVLTS